MATTFKLVAADDTEVEINLPEYGYTTEIHLPISIAERHPTGYTFFDADTIGGYDYRLLNTASLLIPAAQQTALNAFFRDVDDGRGENVTLRLGASATGFFPFGPDLGDKGDFVVRMLKVTSGGRLYSPVGHFAGEIVLLMISAPAYTLPTEVAQGTMEIGTVDGLMAPQREFEPEALYNFRNDYTRDGTPTSIDGLNAGDAYTTGFNLFANQSKAAAVVAYLVSASGRTSDISLIAGENFYPFGADNADNGTFTCKFLGTEQAKNEVVLKITHDFYDRFTIPLRFWLKS